LIYKMKLTILVTFLTLAAVAALPVVEEKAEPVAVEIPEQPGDLQPAGDDLQTDATIWGLGWGGRRPFYGYGRSYPRWYGGWGGNPYYRRAYYGYPSYGYRSYNYW